MNPSVVQPTGTVSQYPGNIVSDMDGEKVMLSVRNGKYYNLGETGGRMWELIGAGSPVVRIVETLTAEYEVDSSECERDVLLFLNHLLEHELILYAQADEHLSAS
ncbi:lasso peptide biosynthesis PqqD family chaperone [Paenibacillus sepulcri]|uniref:Lasso peptide biosynthesis PqqD family chaperone n=1 Tax=Paenibacillus sepulcri TaxID=359917 RepID=A0ABS7CJW7_9BACL|nr:lasso peptide biosynthesis PqqD family chaperone [Paenibacillus sepulcri]